MPFWSTERFYHLKRWEAQHAKPPTEARASKATYRIVGWSLQKRAISFGIPSGLITNIFGVVRPLLATRQRREVLVALTAAYMLVQLSSLPVALALPSLAEHFDTSVGDAAWIVIVYLLMLGSLVLLMARLGDSYGHARVFLIGVVIATVGAVLLSVSRDLWHLIVLRGLTGVGSAMIMGNANAILAFAFPPEERGRAFAVPIIGARFGSAPRHAA